MPKLKEGVVVPLAPELALEPKEGAWGVDVVFPNKDGVEVPEVPGVLEAGAPTFPKRPPPLELVLELF